MEHSTMHLSLAHCTEQGNRDSNQDFIGFCANEQIGCFALADGAGGHQGGAEASRAVVSEVLRMFQAAPCDRCMDAAWLLEVAREALISARARHPDFGEMNSTVAALLLNSDTRRATWCQLGDSRIYLFRNERAHQLSHDHSVLQAMIDAGLTRGESRGHQDRSMLYAAVGSPETPPTAVCDAPLEVLPGDVFLLCSDGFWDELPETAMEQALKGAVTPEQWLQRMFLRIQQSAHQPDMDNFSALTVWAGQRLEVTRIPEMEDSSIRSLAWSA